MGQLLHDSATTTHAVIAELVEQYYLSPKTGMK